MIPLRHNFLSPKKRKHLKHLIDFQFAKNILEIILMTLSFAGIILLGGQWVLQSYFNDLTGQLVSINSQYSQTNKEIKEINEILAGTEKVQNKYISWSKIIREFSDAVPNNIAFNVLQIDYQSKIFNMSGFAPVRQDLLDLQKSLGNISWLEKIDIPISQLTEKQNIPFFITAKIK